MECLLYDRNRAAPGDARKELSHFEGRFLLTATGGAVTPCQGSTIDQTESSVRGTCSVVIRLGLY